ncbi:hypothetical protein LAZ67_23000861 [Cordylochernes scorpioides]|uniref:Retrovirus-related Pol polyprotein from transposon TNT 1-94 n=1 Tax=Cordylochernes scorpioides TaxID=51811 RepID=A0ABY6LQN1_9ARAC|nr:hypothetical protein LAZ67_23000861 [Cordylochernes scorpioides]
MDLIGPFQHESIGREIYVLNIVDDFSRKIFPIFLKSKLETFAKLKEFIELIENIKGTKIKRIRSDNGGEFKNRQLSSYLIENGIEHQFTTFYSPSRNGIVERANRSLIEGTRALLIESQLPPKFWAEAMNTYSYIKNRTPHKRNDKTIPEELFTRKKPTIKHLKVFGCRAEYWIPKFKRYKFEKITKSGIFVGYSNKRKAFRICDPKNYAITETRDVSFIEKEKGAELLSNEVKAELPDHVLIDLNFCHKNGQKEEEPIPINQGNVPESTSNEPDEDKNVYNLRPTPEQGIYYESSLSDEDTSQDDTSSDPTYHPVDSVIKVDSLPILPTKLKETIFMSQPKGFEYQEEGLGLEEVDIILIRAKFERLTILNDRLILIDDKIKDILLDDPRSTEAQINDEMEQCETYSLQVGIVAQKVKEYESKLAAPCDDKMSQSSTSDVKRQIKLPKFELKKYTGELEEWLSWWSHFEKIHLDKSLSDVDKFGYLIQSMVVGSKAHRLVTSFPLAQKNYNKVIEDLKDRFGNRDMLTELYVRKLLKLVIASARSEKRTLAQLYDDLVAHLHSLGSLGVNTKSGGGAFLYPLVESSLPLELIKIWQRSRTPFKERDHSEIEAGIEHSGAKAFDKLEDGFEPSLPLKQGKRENNPPKIHTASALFVGKTNLPCLFCDKDNHLSQNCFKAAKMLESDRLKRVQDAKVCFKCLRKNHLKKDCRSFVRCKRCQGPHFEIMCRGTSHSQENRAYL